MRRLASIALSTALLAVSTASAQGPCPIAGITTTNYGTGVGEFGPPPTLKLSWNGACGIDIEAVAVTCCNTWIGEHYLAYAPTIFSFAPVDPIPLPSPPFFAGAELYFFPIDIAGPAVGKTSTLQVPPIPQLVGTSWEFQLILTYVTFGQFDGFGTTDAATVVFF